MSRAIKFRAWDTDTNKWVEGIELVIHANGRLLNIPNHIILMQFTGLHDKNGREIYEGDIVDFLDNTSQGLVKKTVVIEDIRSLPDFTCSKWQEVVGNVYENPELLKKEEGV